MLKILPSDLLILSLSGLDLQTPVIHLMHVASRLHVSQDVVLQLWNRLQRIRDVLVLLNISDDFGRLRTLSEVDQIGLLNDRRDTIFDER